MTQIARELHSLIGHLCSILLLDSLVLNVMISICLFPRSVIFSLTLAKPDGSQRILQDHDSIQLNPTRKSLGTVAVLVRNSTASIATCGVSCLNAVCILGPCGEKPARLLLG